MRYYIRKSKAYFFYGDIPLKFNSRYDLKGIRVFSRNNKFYGIDPDLRNSLTPGGNKDYGHILENLVLLELLRIDYKIYTGEIEGYEIDFIC